MLTATNARDLKRHTALHYMEDLLYEHLLHSGMSAKSADLAAVLEADGIKIDSKFIRLSLAESNRFAVEDRRWNTALRGEIRRPFSGLVEFALKDYGKPMPLEALRNEMALVMRRPLEFFDALLTKALEDAEKYYQTETGEWGLRDWLLDTSYRSEEELFLRNFFFRQAEAKEQLEELLDTRMATDQPAEQMAIKLLRKIGHPLDHPLLCFALWKLREGDIDSKQVFAALLAEERVLLLSGVQWALTEWKEEWIGELRKLSKRAEKLDDLPWLEEEPEEGAFVISDKDIKEMLGYVKKQHGAVSLKDLLQNILEVVPASSRWTAVAQAVTHALEQDKRLQRVGSQSWTIPTYVPKVDKAPRALLLEQIPTKEEETDAELEDDGLEAGLSNWVHDPRYEELGEEEEIEAVGDQPISEIRCVASLHHIKAGTLKLRKNDLAFYPIEADPACLTFKDEEKDLELEAWASRRAGLLFGLDPWYEEAQIQPGDVFTIIRSQEPDEYLIKASGEKDPLLNIAAENQKILRSLKKEAAKKEWSVFEIMCRIMADFETGISFLNLWAQVNAVRRTRKRTIASNLSSYHCFSQRPAGADSWLFDERRVSLGRKKTKRRFIRAQA